MRPRVFFAVLGVETRKLMSYRADFWLNALAAFFIELAVAYFLWLAVFESTGKDRIGGFTFRGMVLYYVLAILLGKLVRGQERQIGLAQDIYEGSLTKYLLYPSPYFGFKYAEHLGALLPGIVQLALLGSLSLPLLGLPPELAVSPGSILRAAMAVAVGNLLFFLILYPVQGIAFWADNVWTLNVIVRFIGELLGGLWLPLSLFPDGAQRVLEVLPFRYLFYFPVMTLLGRVGPREWALGMMAALLWCAAIAAAGRVVWRRGYLAYTAVGI